MELPIRISKDSREPIYHQIVNQFKALIAGGHLSAGTPLPSIRVLSKDLEISIITTRRAYQDLEVQGFIKTSQGKGTFVADISEDLKQEVKVTSVYNILENAVDTALSYDYSLEQVKTIFLEILKSKEKGDI
ncbi:GntR family transcriptional regulator [Ornithinibacillus massiliensis]|uniref:GntR family transcriptional regulator n=1 Tax=Ornithinibacillus massiliensis TaxID=1944633 RepID=A0ABS5M9Y4_9BACI|nr:GntR family transcriptional regulator [Ornithinibacillus massiliensis]MBS3679118.1 GntR family transcriptional regulator [Ornithinibacillus massiliensis]